MAITTAELITKLRAGESVASAAYDPAKQAAGYTKRLEGAGVDVASALDKRNGLEKFLNLNQDQNVFMDIMEIIDRPLNAMAAAMMGEDAWASFTGKEKQEYTYIDVLKRAGMDDVSSTGLGMVLNIVGDPISLALAFASGGTSVAVKASAAAAKSVAMANTVVDTVQVLNATTDVAQAVNAGTDAVKITKEALSKTLAPLVKAWQKAGKSLETAADLAKFFETNADALKAVQGFEKITDFAKLGADSMSAFNTGFKHIKTYNAIKAAESIRKNMFVSEAIDGYNWFGKSVKMFQNMNPLRNPLKYYNALQDVTSTFVAVGVGNKILQTANLGRSLISSASKFALGVDRTLEIAEALSELGTGAKKLFGFFDKISTGVMKKLTSARNILMGDSQALSMALIDQIRNGKSGVALVNAQTDLYNVVLKSTDPRMANLRKLAEQGKEVFLSRTTTAMELMMSTGGVGGAQALLRKQAAMSGAKATEEGLFEFSDFGEGAPGEAFFFDSDVLDENGNLLSLKELEAKNIKIGQREHSYLQTIYDKNRVRGASSSFPEGWDAGKAGAANQTKTSETIRQYYEGMYKDYDIIIVNAHINDNAAPGDLVVLAKGKKNGSSGYGVIGRIEVKGNQAAFGSLDAGSGQTSHIFFNQQTREAFIKSDAFKNLGDDHKQFTLMAMDQMNTLYPELLPILENLKDADGVIVTETIREILSKYFKGPGKGAFAWTINDITYYMDGDDLANLFTEEFADMFELRLAGSRVSGGKTSYEAVTKVDGEDVVKPLGTNTTGGVVGASGPDQRAKVILKQGEGKVAKLKGEVRFKREAWDNPENLDRLTKRLAAKQKQFALSRPTSTLRDILSADRAVILDDDTYKVFEELLAKVNTARGSAAEIYIDEIFEKRVAGNGQTYYGFAEDGEKRLRSILNEVDSKEDVMGEALKMLDNVQLKNPSLISAVEQTEMDELMSLFPDEMQGLQRAHANVMNDMAEKIDSMPGLNTAYKAKLQEWNKQGNYIRHSRDQGVQEILGKMLGKEDTRLLYPRLHGVTNSFNERRYQMSLYEANLVIDAEIKRFVGTDKYNKIISELGTDSIKFFTEDLSKSTMDFFISGVKQKTQASLLNVVVSEDLFPMGDNADSLVRPLTEGNSFAGMIEVDKESFLDQAKKFSQYMGEEEGKAFIAKAEAFRNKLNALGGDQTKILVDAKLYSLVGSLGQANETMGKVGELLDWVNSGFKQFKLMSGGFITRNLIGNYANLALSGIPAGDLALITGQLPTYWNIGTRGPDLVAAVARGDKLSPSDMQHYELFMAYLREGFLGSGSDLKSLEELINSGDKAISSGVVKTAVEKVMGFTGAANEYTDRMFRLALLDYATRHPSTYLRAGFESAGDFVRFSLFDPKDLTPFEKTYMRRLMPFYTFTKKNLVYHLQNFTTNTKAYVNANRLIKASYNLVGANYEDIPDYQKENMYVPIPFTGQDGKFLTFQANLPQSDLNEWVNDPLKRILGSLTPLIRAPFEMATNTQIYTGMPISEYEGQKGFKLPMLDRWQEYLLSQTGLDVPIASIYNVSQGDAFKAIGMTTTDLEKARLSKDYDELNQIRDLVSYYKQEGVRLPTLAEIENQSSTNKLDSMLRALNG